MTLETDLVCLKSIPVFRTLPAARLKLVALMGERLTYAPGTRIIAAGDDPEGVYFLLSGQVEMSDGEDRPDGKRFTFGTGEIIGDVPTLCDKPVIGTVVALDRVEVLRLPRDLFFELLRTIPDFSMALSRDLASRLYRLADKVLNGSPANGLNG